MPQDLSAPKRAAVFIVDPASIFRLGMATCLESLAVIREVAEAGSVAEAWDRRELATADLIVVDAAAEGVRAFVREIRETYDTPALVSGSGWELDDITAVLEAGAVGVLAKEVLTPATLETNVRAALHGSSVLPSDLMVQLLGSPETVVEPAEAAGGGQLNPREQQVLRLIADGHATREVAKELCYSERTIKNVLHDVVTKLGARSRSQAVAHAVRSGLI